MHVTHFFRVLFPVCFSEVPFRGCYFDSRLGEWCRVFLYNAYFYWNIITVAWMVVLFPCYIWGDSRICEGEVNYA